ncbi:hypothetical protein D8X55_00420 [Malacoplasma penetrans]|uniref:Single-stranded DNA-binding protein n=1 Tax=Malacoplasma penetrans (strain HF-2) TaxID=272633 RepID=Q8EX14_MALP2|nr:hypothetical protein [Malacoplasma penetrans]RXY97381.1 hypothetical protein D8X55_00420 [Malacoplasma penetrans]BAC43826.1 hypothetical protein [Malacoplasma penetrans HF-2]
MNLIAMIGTVDKVRRDDQTSIVTLKVEKPFFDSTNENDFFDTIDVNVNSALFSQDLSLINSGVLLGLKGRLRNDNQSLKVVAEKIQIF